MTNAQKKALKKKMGDKKEDEYEMPKSKAVSEHERLIKVLKSKKGLSKEAKIQGRELLEIRKTREKD